MPADAARAEYWNPICWQEAGSELERSRKPEDI